MINKHHDDMKKLMIPAGCTTYEIREAYDHYNGTGTTQRRQQRRDFVQRERQPENLQNLISEEKPQSAVERNDAYSNYGSTSASYKG
eukprot:3743734-Amphidinium_carterae.1